MGNNSKFKFGDHVKVIDPQSKYHCQTGMVGTATEYSVSVGLYDTMTFNAPKTRTGRKKNTPFQEEQLEIIPSSMPRHTLEKHESLSYRGFDIWTSSTLGVKNAIDVYAVDMQQRWNFGQNNVLKFKLELKALQEISSLEAVKLMIVEIDEYMNRQGICKTPEEETFVVPSERKRLETLASAEGSRQKMEAIEQAKKQKKLEKELKRKQKEPMGIQMSLDLST